MDTHTERPAKPSSSAAETDRPAVHGLLPRDGHPKHRTGSSLPSSRRPSFEAATAVKPSERRKASTGSSAAKSDSEAETIVLPGKNGHSPSKVRKTIKHEERSEDEGELRVVGDTARRQEGNARAPPRDGSLMLGKRKRPKHDNLRDEVYAGNSSGLSSVPTSPVTTHRSSLSKQADSDSDRSSTARHPRRDGDRLKPVDHLIRKRRPYDDVSDGDGDDDDDDDARRVGRDAHDQLKQRRTPAPHRESSVSKRSVSPRGHRRSASTSFGGSALNGLAQKKKKIPAPLRATTRDRSSADDPSDDSSTSGSPHPRNSRVRSLATPAAEHSATSPAKMAPHKKHRDNIGRTYLARACAAGDIDLVKMRFEERASDIDLADNAGNTPLQIAALEGSEDIVKFLIDNHCDVHCVNNDRDTPLLDAVENGHLDVVKLLLDAGVNPRRANVNGEEPLDLVNDDVDNADEMRQVLRAARKKNAEARRASDDHGTHDNNDGRSSHGTGSPRHSPPMQTPGLPASGRRAASGRSTKTSNYYLYMPMDSKALRVAAGKGDEETVIRILQVRDGLDDPESMVAAARGGHDNVINLLLGLGGANPDPAPVKSVPTEVSTPILAAIGRENLEVIKLLLAQREFDATRKFGGETYHEIARRRAGPRWKEEEELLREAYQTQVKKKKAAAARPRSPGLKRDVDRDKKSRSESSISSTHKRKLSDETTDRLKKSIAIGDAKMDRLKATKLGDVPPVKRGPGRPRKEPLPLGTSDGDPAAFGPPKPSTKPERAESDATATSETEAPKPRRKLVSGKDLKGDRERIRRASITSTSSTMSAKDRERPPTTDLHSAESSRMNLPRSSSDPEFANDKSLDRARKLKRDDSRNRLSAIRGDSPAKRPRSDTPPRSESQDPASRKPEDNQLKRRRLDDAKGADPRPEKRSLLSDKPRDRDVHMTDAAEAAERAKAKESRRDGSVTKPMRREDSDRKPTDVKREEERVSTAKSSKDVVREKEAKLQEKRQAEVRVKKEDDEEKRKRREEDERHRRKDDERRKREEEDERKRVEEERRAKIARDEKAREEKARDEERRKQEESKRREEEARRRAQELKRQQEEAKRLQEEAEARERKLKEEAEARQREEEERRRVLLEQQRLKNEEMERRKEQRLREQLRIRQEQEEARLAKLPPLLRWFEKNNHPGRDFAPNFCRIQGVRYDTIKPSATGTPEGKDQWLLNTQVALLLGEKDLQLMRYTAWPREPATELAKRTLWRVEADRYALTSSELRTLREANESRVSFRVAERLKAQALDLFLALDLFFVKLSDFLYIVPNFPHLRNLKMTVEYCELPPDASFLNTWTFPPKWKQDPDTDANAKFAPSAKCFVNGELVREHYPPLVVASKTPFPEHRVPRRGFAQVFPDDPDYEKFCVEQGLTHLLTTTTTTTTTTTGGAPPHGMLSAPNGLMSMKLQANGMTPPDSDVSTNDDACAAVKPKAEGHHALSNGINGVW